MTPERFTRIKQALKKRQRNLTVVTDGVHKSQNLSAIVRTCDAAGIEQVHFCLREQQDYQLHHRTSGGAGNWVMQNVHYDCPALLRQFRQQGFRICAAHLSDQAMNYHDYDFCQPTVVVMGAEKPGISQAVADIADHHIIIPMHGMVESFNVSVAAAIILNEAVRQRACKGLYQTSQYSDSEFTHHLFRWCYPRLAGFCDQHCIPYPELDDSGLIIYTSEWSQHVRSCQSPDTENFQPGTPESNP